MLESANIFVTGGAGTIGHALARRRKEEGWAGKMTVYSTDTMKHEVMRREYPDINYIQGDIRNFDTLYGAMVGHDVVIHAAAVKVIPASEFNSVDTFDVNVNGSRNVCSCAITAGIKHVLGISTDKSCYPINAYGASKLMMEKIFFEYARMPLGVQYHLVRYGNILVSNGSVVEAWRNSVANGQPIKITNSKMTRFYLSPQQGINCIIRGMSFPSGLIYIPKCPALSLGKLAEYVVGEEIAHDAKKVPIRPGEKMHETLLTQEETLRADEGMDSYRLNSSTEPEQFMNIVPYSSDTAPELTKQELLDLLANG